MNINRLFACNRTSAHVWNDCQVWLKNIFNDRVDGLTAGKLGKCPVLFSGERERQKKGKVLQKVQ
ncbi:hypothetical protein Desaci_2195 [Desulfosporosinus acidiphilus SJ4]|uniref:Uncharacterized protein n=1 Tax=Desulfosporosinus acidiphilus (strain DSM 22704 / JCM 16185 / SJ4) TaxID=646529 RepID=I4D5T3_DESAJ|nr:hypothetical protein Desaci_2195 [Desulfosporosinus acidiphilus SJ4]